jgi:hypothetical protein
MTFERPLLFVFYGCDGSGLKRSESVYIFEKIGLIKAISDSILEK